MTVGDGWMPGEAYRGLSAQTSGEIPHAGTRRRILVILRDKDTHIDVPLAAHGRDEISGLCSKRITVGQKDCPLSWRW